LVVERTKQKPRGHDDDHHDVGEKVNNFHCVVRDNILCDDGTTVEDDDGG